MEINLIINKEKYPDIFKNDSNITNEIYDLIDLGYNLKYNKNKVAKNDMENICRKLKDDILRGTNNDTKLIHNKLELINKNVDSLNSKEIKEKIDSLNDLLGDLFGISKSSSKKGEISEDFICNLIKNQYKNYCYDVKRSIPHNADGELSSASGLVSLVEIKNYTNTVNKKEIEKFKFDLYHTGRKYGLFLSLQSGIVGKNTIDYEKINHNNKTYHIIFISKMFNDKSKLDSGILLLENIYKIQNANNNKNIEWIQDNLINHLKDLNKVIDKTDNLKNKFLQMETGIKLNLENFYLLLREYDYELKDKLKTIWKKIVIEFNKSNDLLLKLDNTDTILNTFKNDKCYPILLRLFDILKNNNKIVNNSLEIFDEKMDLIGFIKKMKEKVILNLNEPNINISFNVKLDNDINFDFVNKLF